MPAACWCTAALLGSESLASAWTIAVLAAGMGLIAAVGLRRGHSGAWRVLLLVSALAVCAVAVSSAARVHALASPPWPMWGEQRATVDVRLRLTQTPVQVTTTTWADAGAATTQTARADVVSAAGADGVLTTQARVLARIDGDISDTRLRKGDLVAGQARVAPGDQRAGVVARLDLLAVESIEPDAGFHGRVDRAFRESLAKLNPDSAALVQGLALGEDADLSSSTREAMRVAGLSHLTAVSGANIAMVVAVAMWAARTAGVSRRGALIPAAAAMAGYVWLVGPEPSVVRAAAMASVALVGVLLGGGSGIAALASAVTVLLVWDPGLASSRGFALSCVATAGLIAAAPWGRRSVARLRAQVPGLLVVPATVLVAALVTAVAAAVATAPLLASYGEGVSWASVLANVLVSPVVPLVTVGGLVVAALSLVATPIAVAFAWVPGAGAGWIVTVATWAVAIPGGRIALPGGWRVGLVVVAVVVLVAVMTRRWSRAPLWLTISAVTAAVAHAAMPTSLRGVPPQWVAVFCDVGQGDATVLRTGPESAVLVDAGPAPDIAMQCLRRVGIRRLDAVILSHFHRDHVEGFPQVARAMQPALTWVSPLADPPEQAAHVRSAAATTGTEVLVPVEGQTARWGSVSMQVLGPGRLVREGSAPNNASLAVVAEMTTSGGPVRVLLSGDVEPEAQAALMAAVSDPRVDVAKVPHHGSANQHPAYSRWAAAQWAVVSCGSGNDYGHPAASTLRDWQASGATTLRTDLQGDIFISVDDAGGITAHVTREAR